MDTQKLKHLQVNQAQLDAEIKDLKTTVINLNKQISERTIKFNAISNEIKNIHNKNPIITEHALLRYVERILHVDLEKVKKEILSDNNVKIINELRSCKIPINNKFKIVVKNKSIVTVEDL